MLQLHPTLDLGRDETPTSFASRLALLQGCRHLKNFCADLALSFQGLVCGDPTVIAQLALLSGVPQGALQANAFVRDGNNTLIRGQKLNRVAAQMTHVKICPKCAADDIQTSGLAPEISIHDRLHWNIASIRTCAAHNTAIVDLGVVEGTNQVYDFARYISATIDRIEGLPDIARPASTFEQYLLGRLNSAPKTLPWLDGLEFYVAAKVCEILGAVAFGGRYVAVKAYTHEDWYSAGQAGFEIAAGGEPSIRAFLLEMQETFEPYKGVAHDGPQGVFGALYIWAHAIKNSDYDPFRAIFRRHIIETMPVGPEDVIFGRPVEKRILHSIRTAHLAFGAHPKRLRKILATQGLLADGHEARADNLVLFDADRAQALNDRGVLDGLSLTEVETYLNAGRVHAKLLADAGIIKPAIRSNGDIGANAFAKADVDNFLETLLQGAETIATTTGAIDTIPAAAKRANCGAVEIVRLILDRQLAWTGKLKYEAGYLSVLVNVDEIKAKTRGEALDGLTARQIEKDMRVATRVVVALIERGVLPTVTTINPINRCPVKITPRTDYEAFRAKYVTLFQLAAERGVHFKKLKNEIEAAGIHQALDREKFHAIIYLRSDVSVSKNVPALAKR